MWFRGSGDSGRRAGTPPVTVSRDWWVWRVGERHEHVGELAPRFHTAEIGAVVAPDSLVHRMRTGSYDFIYPGY